MPVLEVALFLSCCLVQMKEESGEPGWNWLMPLGWIISIQLPGLNGCGCAWMDLPSVVLVGTGQLHRASFVKIAPTRFD